jgi:hypothetical protein
MAFRAWNRGLAATTPIGPERNPYGVWLFNGTRWFPDPTFPGHSVCPGTTVAWAGQRDHWLIGGGFGERFEWPRLCRFDSHNHAWQPLEVPAATLQRVTPPPTPETPNPRPKAGAISVAACFAWDNCWFFGSFGAVLHWDGRGLADVSPERALGWLQGEYTAAVARRVRGDKWLGAAVGATSARLDEAPLPAQPGGAAPPQLYGSDGGPFSPLTFTPQTTAQENDPFRTDLVAVDFDAAGQGWVAGNPAGLRLSESAELEDPTPPPAREFSTPSPQPSPLQPVSSSGAAAGCTGPPPGRFTFTPFPTETQAAAQEGAFLWSSIAVIPGADEALAGGRMRRALASAGSGNEDARIGEPVVAQASCEGATSTTRFRVPDPLHPGQSAPADRGGSVTAIAATTSTDAWVATTSGRLENPNGFFFDGINERPHIYRLSPAEPR